jgi:hypothetical protein
MYKQVLPTIPLESINQLANVPRKKVFCGVKCVLLNLVRYIAILLVSSQVLLK